uniref:Nuclear pore complex protein Nup85 n=1 Tax=Culicoides sonorensis TaxID=179676 RepID=A0A336M568_CULSO
MDNIVIKGIEDSLGENVGRYCGNFCTDQKISFHAFEPIISSSRDVPSKHFNQRNKVNVHQLEPEFVFNIPVLRALLSETSNIFVELQKSVANPEIKTNFQKFSLTYRSSIRACLENLQQLVENQDENKLDSDLHEKYQNFMTILYSIECIWHLCEKLFLNKANEGMILQNLLEWVRFHFPMSERNALELMQIGQEVDADENYWPVIKDLVIKGQMEVARTLLKMHLSSDTPCFQEAERILSTMPIYSVYGGLSLQKFRTQLKYWAVSAESKVQTGLLAAEPELEEIVRLVIGDRQAWKDLCKTSTCWYEYFPGYLLYTEPTCKNFELPQHVNAWLTQWLSSQNMGRTAHLKHLDRVILSVMENNLHQVLHDIQNIGDNKWVVTHLTDLLFHSGQLQLGEGSVENLNAFRDSLIFDFGTALMARKSFWNFGLNYLEYCSDGPAARELLLLRIPFKTDKEASKLISAARRINSPQCEQQICRVMTKLSINNERYGDALHWAIRSNDQVYIRSVVDVFLHHYTETGEMLSPDNLASIGSRMLVCPRLMFLVKYYDFHQFYRERAFSQAGEVLINLLDSNITPPYFWSSLLADTIPLLEFKEPIIPSKETLTILHHLENDLMPLIEKKKQALKRKEAGDAQMEDPIIANTLHGRSEDLVQLLRLSCARNLSRALIIENTLGP